MISIANETVQNASLEQSVRTLQICSDVVIHVWDEEELMNETQQLANLTGATLLNDLVPFLTTHVVCLKETQLLRSRLNSLHARNIQGAMNMRKALSTDTT